jgi:hypothetical protein
MILTVHNLAHAYKCLPSDILANATTFDLYVLDVHTKWVKYQHQEAENKRAVPNAPPRPVMKQEQLLDMIKRTRSKK